MTFKPRYLQKYLLKDLNEKILILTGPRQCGKTMLSQHFSSSKSYDYFNYFDPQDRLMIENKQWNRRVRYLVFDELHIKTDWKKWLKALYEKEGLKQGIVVTGSSRLQAYNRSGDSLAGCFFTFRLHPFDLKELCQIHKNLRSETLLTRLLEVGGFPEPFFKGSKVFYNRWQKTHTEAILKEDLLELDRYHRISQLKTLLELLKSSVGKTIQYESFAKTLGCDGKTIKKMLDLLEAFYFVFKVPPYYSNISKSIRKQAKYYFYDIPQVEEKGSRFENLVALALLKKNHFQEDCFGEKKELFYIRNRDKKEIDFLLTKNNQPSHLIEAKWKDDRLSPHFDLFAKDLPAGIKKTQVVRHLEREKTTSSGHRITKASTWLKTL